MNSEGKKQIILLLDRAGFHTSKGLEVPQGIELFYLPPYTPELQPAERLWPLLREAIANKVWTTLSALENAVEKRYQWLSKNRKKVQAHVGFQWICKSKACESRLHFLSYIINLNPHSTEFQLWLLCLYTGSNAEFVAYLTLVLAYPIGVNLRTKLLSFSCGRGLKPRYCESQPINRGFKPLPQEGPSLSLQLCIGFGIPNVTVSKTDYALP